MNDLPASETTPTSETTANDPPSNRVGIIIFLVAAVLIAVIVFRIAFPEDSIEEAMQHDSVGKEFSAVRLKSLTGEAGPIENQNISGKVVLLNLWSPTCGPCVQEFPHMARLSQDFSDREDFLLLPVTVTTGLGGTAGELRDAVERFLSKLPRTVPTFTDVGNSTVNSAWNVGAFAGGIPVTIILDRKRTVRAVWTGYRPGYEDAMRRVVEKLLEEPTGEGD